MYRLPLDAPKPDQGPTLPRRAWYCLHARPKHEHIAAAHLRQQPDVEVYLPRLRFKRATRHGPVWFTEALFPGYLFARFDLAACWRKVHHAAGVRGLVRFGNHWPAIPDSALEELRAAAGPSHLHVISDELNPGDAVVISGGVFDTLRGVVTRVMPARQRVAVLLDFLGRQTPAELAAEAVVKDCGVRTSN